MIHRMSAIEASPIQELGPWDTGVNDVLRAPFKENQYRCDDTYITRYLTTEILMSEERTTESIRERLESRTKPFEKEVGLLLLEEFGLDSYDTAIKGGGRKRPDFVLEGFEYFKVIVEVDEKQHSGYGREDEVSRMREIYSAFERVDVLFVRYNPDKYRPNCIGDEVLPEMKFRHDKLLSNLRRYKDIKTLPYRLCYIKLFYDISNEVPKPIYPDSGEVPLDYYIRGDSPPGDRKIDPNFAKAQKIIEQAHWERFKLEEEVRLAEEAYRECLRKLDEHKVRFPLESIPISHPHRNSRRISNGRSTSVSSALHADSGGHDDIVEAMIQRGVSYEKGSLRTITIPDLNEKMPDVEELRKQLSKLKHDDSLKEVAAKVPMGKPRKIEIVPAYLNPFPKSGVGKPDVTVLERRERTDIRL